MPDRRPSGCVVGLVAKIAVCPVFANLTGTRQFQHSWASTRMLFERDETSHRSLQQHKC